MKLLSLDPKATKARVRVQTSQDIWRLSELLEPGDLVTARTERKVKVNEDAAVRKMLTLSLIVERSEVQADALRIFGVIAEGLDDVPKGAHHTITLGIHDEATIEKEWAGWQLDKLREEDSHVILVLLMDREEAVFAVLRREPEVLATIKGTVQKKGMDGGSPYWEELAEHLAAYDERLHPRHIVIASPAFFKEYVLKLLPAELAKKTVAATISATGAAAMAELVRRPELRHVLEQERFANETALVDRLLAAVHQDKAAWGEREVAELAPSGALELVLVSKALLQRTREENRYDGLRETLQAAESTKATVSVLDTSAAVQLDKLGGIAAVRRW